MFRIKNEDKEFGEIPYSAFSDEENEEFLNSIDFTELFNKINDAAGYNFKYNREGMEYDKYDGYVIESENVASKCGPLSKFIDDVHVRIEMSLNSTLAQRLFARAKICYGRECERIDILASYRRGKWSFSKKGDRD